MSHQTFDAFTRTVGQAATRRSSILALGGAALAAGMATQVGTEAKKKPVKKVKKKNAAKCAEEIAECKAIITALTASAPDPAIRAAALACCDNCFAGDFMTCLIPALSL
jgi:hypothetical protein